MLFPLAISLPSLRLLMLGGAAVILYVVGRLVMGAIPARIDRSMLRAMIAATSVLVVSVTCALMHRPQVAMHLPIAAATAALTFGLAALIVGRPIARVSTGSVGVRSWALVVPAVAILLIGGLGGRVNLAMIAALMTYGIAALAAWLPDRPATRSHEQSRAPQHLGHQREPYDAVDDAGPSRSGFSEVPLVAQAIEVDYAHDGPPVRGESASFALLLWIGGVGLAALAGALAVLGLPALDAVRQMPSDALATVFLIAPAIVVPLVFELLPPCRPMGWSASVSSLAKFALISLCFVLPVVSLVCADADVIRGWQQLMTATPTTLPATFPAETSPAMIFPSIPALPLRADLLVLAGASLLLLPLAAGSIRPGKLEAVALFGCYVLNLMLVMASMIR